MFVPDVELHNARSVAEASAHLDRFAPDVRALAGGTDLLVDLKMGRIRVGHVVSLRRLPELRGITPNQDGVRIGAFTSPNQLAESPLIREHFAALLDSIHQMAAPQVRNMATVGGNVASAVPSADLPPLLIAYRAAALLCSRSAERRIPLESFFLGPRRSVARPDEVLTALHLPLPPPGFGAAYARFSLREANACAVAAVAASLELARDRSIRAARVVLCAVGPVPKLVEDAGESLVGRFLDDDTLAAAATAAMAAAQPISDIRASADYRRELVGILTRRALVAARRRCADQEEPCPGA